MDRKSQFYAGILVKTAESRVPEDVDPSTKGIFQQVYLPQAASYAINLLPD
jgi:hypothetical protein